MVLGTLGEAAMGLVGLALACFPQYMLAMARSHATLPCTAFFAPALSWTG